MIKLLYIAWAISRGIRILIFVYQWGWLQPLHFFRPAETLVSATKWLHLIAGTSFAIILPRKKIPPTLGWG